ncbi:MAG: (Fe-S)-binding protein [Desulfovibrio sp.]|jgi:glycolate oxidase iron-sulfur subunit|nr:(Fe-S)-binding protein [Desulfovibrio sp.]
MKRGCTQCGECLNVCPVYQQYKREQYSPKGKRILMEPIDNGDSPLPWERVKFLSRLCAGCGRCKDVCARKLSTADLLADVRSTHPHWTQYMWELWISHMGPFWPALGFFASLTPDAVTPGPLRSSLAMAKALPAPKEGKPWVVLKKNPAVTVDPTPVVVFAGCTANNARPLWRAKTEKLLKAWGYTALDSSSFVCCGGTLHHAGQYKAMHAMQEKNTAVWKELGRPRIAAFCASCHHSLAEYAEKVLQGEDAALWKKSLTPLSTLLAGAQAEITPDKPAEYGYHHPCHWGANGDRDQPFLADIVPGLKKGADVCCGMGGVLKMTDPDLSMRMADACLASFPSSARDILTGCSGCAMQLSAAAPKGTSVHHWLDVVSV